ncbi:hypothetical protein K474DRAFT_1710250 [Panus rudis PR-1116 ss-1]|nr:hypothetical protein K474DRAFT_1710250 [Panus rudis PR-1116 ss-1]
MPESSSPGFTDSLSHALASTDSGARMKTEIQELGNFIEQFVEYMVNVHDIWLTASKSGTDFPYPPRFSSSVRYFFMGVQTSSGVAADALVVADDFISNVIGILLDEKTTVEEKQQKARSFVDSLDKAESEAQYISQLFSNIDSRLKQDLVDTHERLSWYAGHYSVVPAEQRALELNELISDDFAQMKYIQSAMDSCFDQLKSDLGEDVGETVRFLGDLCPELLIHATAMNTQALQDASYLMQDISRMSHDYNAALAEYNKNRAERAQLQGTLSGIPLVRTIVGGIDTDVQAAIHKIGSLATIWAAIRADAQAVLNSLTRVTGTQSLCLITARLTTTGNMYKALQSALREYVARLGWRTSVDTKMSDFLYRRLQEDPH